MFDEATYVPLKQIPDNDKKIGQNGESIYQFRFIKSQESSWDFEINCQIKQITKLNTIPD